MTLWLRLAAAAAVSSSAGVVVLRGGMVVDAPIEEIGSAGVRVGGGEPRWIGWHRVKRVSGDRSAEASAYVDVADRAWRAVMRLERGDVALAHPAFESLWLRYAGESGPTARAVAEGLASCRLALGDAYGAVGPWLATLGEGEGLSVEDLRPELPPIFVVGGGSSSADAERAAGWSGHALAGWYAAALDADRSVPALSASSDEATRFVAALVGAQRGDADAAGELRAVVEGSMGTWREAWSRCALGRYALVRAEDDDDLVSAALMLLHVPARFGATLSGLSAIACADAGGALLGAGRVGEALSLLAEAERLDPGGAAVSALRRAIEGASSPADGGEGS